MATGSKEKLEDGIYGASMFRHFYLRGKNLGPSIRMTGDVALVNLLIDDGGSLWTPGMRGKYEHSVKEAMRELSRQAAQRGVSLNLKSYSLPVKPQPGQKSDRNPRLLKALRAGSFTELHRFYCLNLRCDDAAILQVFNEKSRSSAVMSSTRLGDEYCSIYYTSRGFEPRTIMHELCHLFGAPDYYFPDFVKEAANRWLPGSLMCGGTRVDDLTAYLIGWTKSLTDPAYQFLKATRAMDEDRFKAALDAEWKKAYPL